MLERRPVEILHRDEGFAFIFSDFVNRADVGMIQCGRGSRLAPKPFQRLFVVSNFFGQEFQGYGTTEFSVLGPEHDSHAATAKFLQDSVVRDSLADHCLESKAWRARVRKQNSEQLPSVSMVEGRSRTVKAFEQGQVSS